MRDLDRGTGAVGGLEDYQGQAYVETSEASWLLFVGNVECFSPDHYERAPVSLIDLILSEPAAAVGAPRAGECDTGSSATTEIDAID